MNIKISDRKILPHDLLLTIRQKTKLRSVFENNMSTDIKLSKSQISKIIQSGGFLGSFLSKLAGTFESSSSLGKTYFSSIKNNRCWFSNWCRNSKENTWFWSSFRFCFASKNFNDLKQTNGWHKIESRLNPLKRE